jgi:hypothetical protein
LVYAYAGFEKALAQAHEMLGVPWQPWPRAD